MDNVCHTLVGAAIGAAGLNGRTRFNTAALLISANLPDIDVLVFATSTPSVEFRRGWTHGILAQLLLPVVLTAIFVLAARIRPRPADEGPPVRVGWLLLLSYVGVYSHVFLDFLNTYGVRLATPFSWQWFYGDAVFIVDPWMWLMLGVGVWMTQNRDSARYARTALVCVACYIVAMMVSARVARGIVEREWTEMHGSAPRAAMIGPLPVWPFAREVIVDAGDHYQAGRFSWWSRRLTLAPELIKKNSDLPEVAVARQAPNVRAFLVWTRFPVWTLEKDPRGTRVTVGDMRFMGVGRTFAASTIVPGPRRPGDAEVSGP